MIGNANSIQILDVTSKWELAERLTNGQTTVKAILTAIFEGALGHLEAESKFYLRYYYETSDFYE
jgi:hypothetical protein